MSSGQRGQSSVVGTALLIAFVVIAAVTLFWALNAFVLVEPAPAAGVTETYHSMYDPATNKTFHYLELSHRAGDIVDLNDTRVVVEAGDQRLVDPPRIDKGDSSFVPGGQVYYDLSELDLCSTNVDEVEVSFAHGPSRTVILQNDVEVFKTIARSTNTTVTNGTTTPTEEFEVTYDEDSMELTANQPYYVNISILAVDGSGRVYYDSPYEDGPRKEIYYYPVNYELLVNGGGTTDVYTPFPDGTKGDANDQRADNLANLFRSAPPYTYQTTIGPIAANRGVASNVIYWSPTSADDWESLVGTGRTTTATLGTAYQPPGTSYEYMAFTDDLTTKSELGSVSGGANYGGRYEDGDDWPYGDASDNFNDASAWWRTEPTTAFGNKLHDPDGDGTYQFNLDENEYAFLYETSTDGKFNDVFIVKELIPDPSIGAGGSTNTTRVETVSQQSSVNGIIC
jgi:flagellin-like protein